MISKIYPLFSIIVSFEEGMTKLAGIGGLFLFIDELTKEYLDPC